MRTRLQRVTVFVMYQLSLIAGILLLPVALLMSRLGLTLPMHKVVDRIGSIYENTKTAGA